MAESIRFECNVCRREIIAWSDGDPYYIDLAGRKKYAHHPDIDGLKMCIGYDSPHLCLACGKKFNVDSLAPIAECPKCHSGDIADTYELDGVQCPYCKSGVIKKDSDYYCI